MIDVCIIGAGIVGSAIARRLSRYELDICLVEREDDVAMGSTKANSAIVHGGYAESNSKLKGRLCYQGRRQFAKLEEELHFGFSPIGSLVLGMEEEDLPKLRALEENGRTNGLEDVRILGREEVLAMEPSLNPEVRYALYCEGAGVCSPYGMAIALVENALHNGVKLYLKEEVAAISKADGGYLVRTDKREIAARYVINCAGLHSAKVAAMVLGDPGFSIRPRSGEYIICNRGTGRLLNKVAFQMPSAMGKGILVTPTYHGNLLIGPDAIDEDGEADRSTHVERLANIYDQALRTVPKLDPGQFLRSFAGVRAVSSTDDFIVEESASPGFFQAAGIQSPGLTSSPAIADRMAELLERAGCPLREREDYDPFRAALPGRKEMLPASEIPPLLEKTGPERMICRCEQVAQATIVEAMRRGIPVTSVDGVKRRTRASMGFCQGAFCRPRFIQLMEQERGEAVDPRTDAEKAGLHRVNKAEFLNYLKDRKTGQ